MPDDPQNEFNRRRDAPGFLLQQVKQPMADDAQDIKAPTRASAPPEAQPNSDDAARPGRGEDETGGEEAASSHRDEHEHKTMAGVVALGNRGDAPVDELASTGRDELLAVVTGKIDEGVDRILAVFKAKLAYDSTKQVQIDRLHEELLQHRSNLAARSARPLIHGMIRLHDDIGKLLAALRTKSMDELTPARFFSLLDGIQEDVEIVLSHNGVAAYREPSGPFDPRRQRVLKVVATAEESLAGTVAGSIRAGFEQGTEILEKERVATFEFVQPTAGTPGEASSEASEGDEFSRETQEKEG